MQENENRLVAESKISEARRKEFQEREGRFRAVFEAAGIGVSTADLSGRMMTANPSWLRMMGYSADEITSLNFWDFAHPDDVAADKQLFQKLIAGELPQYQLEKRYYTKAGEALWCRVTVSLVRSTEGPAYVVKLVENITERRLAEENERKLIAEQAARSEAEDNLALLSSVLQHMPAGVAIVDRSGRLLMMNRQMTALNQLAGSTNGNPTAGSAVLATIQEAALARAIQHREVLEQKEVSFEKTEGSTGILRISAAPVLDHQGRIVAAVTTAYDVTENKKAEEALRTSEKLASVGRLAATIAHEINNPLESVTNILFLLQSNAALPAGAKQLVQMAEEELGRVVHIVRQTLGFYRESSSPVPVDLIDVVKDILALYSRKLEEERATVIKSFKTVSPVLAYPGEMRQVFSNLIVNALDAIGNNGEGRVAIKVSRSVDWSCPERKGVRVLVADNGSGISSENLKKIFEPFFSTKGEKGTGLGLWVSDGIVRKHGGTIRVRSSRNPRYSGTSFSVFIPEMPTSARSAA